METRGQIECVSCSEPSCVTACRRVQALCSPGSLKSNMRLTTGTVSRPLEAPGLGGKTQIRPRVFKFTLDWLHGERLWDLYFFASWKGC